MKKLFFTIALGAAAISASAVTPFAEFQPLQAGDNFTAFNIQGGFKAKVHPAVTVGAGLGITQRWNFDVAPLVPIFVRGEYSHPFKGFNPFVSFDVGYEINTENTKYGAVLVNPMVGVKFGRWYGGIGYLGHCWTNSHGGSTSCFNMKIGYNF